MERRSFGLINIIYLRVQKEHPSNQTTLKPPTKRCTEQSWVHIFDAYCSQVCVLCTYLYLPWSSSTAYLRTLQCLLCHRKSSDSNIPCLCKVVRLSQSFSLEMATATYSPPFKNHLWQQIEETIPRLNLHPTFILNFTRRVCLLELKVHRLTHGGYQGR